MLVRLAKIRETLLLILIPERSYNLKFVPQSIMRGVKVRRCSRSIALRENLVKVELYWRNILW